MELSYMIDVDRKSRYKVKEIKESKFAEDVYMIKVQERDQEFVLINLGYYSYISENFFHQKHFETRYYQGYLKQDCFLVSKDNFILLNDYELGGVYASV